TARVLPAVMGWWCRPRHSDRISRVDLRVPHGPRERTSRTEGVRAPPGSSSAERFLFAACKKSDDFGKHLVSFFRLAFRPGSGRDIEQALLQTEMGGPPR